MISVIIPTYTAVDCLKVCLNSLIANQNDKNEIILVIDGNPELYKDVLTKDWDYPINVLQFEQNKGLAIALNTGVIHATNDKILIVNDDNVFPPNWDITLEKAYNENTVVTCNQIEPYASMFKSTIVYDLGTDPNKFLLEKFNDISRDYNIKSISEDGSTFPFLMSKKMFMACGGWDTQYPGPHIVDWDFFLKLELLNLRFIRIHNCNFYHFVARSTKINVSNDTCDEFNKRERLSWQYFLYKWGFPPRNLANNKKSPKGNTYKGVVF